MSGAGPWQGLIDGLAHDPLVLVDVGARGGLQAHWQPVASALTWIAFEPDERSWQGIEASNLPPRRHLIRTALSDKPGTVTFNRASGEGDSSILRPNLPFLRQFDKPERFEIVETIQLPADTLDRTLADLKLKADVIKLDTQGTELAILKGGAATLASGVIAVDVEVELNPMYEDQPLFSDVDAHLRQFDLQLFDVVPRRWPYRAGLDLHLARGPVIWAETVYFRTADALARDVAAAGAPLLVKAVLVALVYGYPDFALALVGACASSVDAATATALETAVREWDAGTTTPNVPWTVELTPAQVRQLHATQKETGTRPNAQLRRAIRAWLESRATG